MPPSRASQHRGRGNRGHRARGNATSRLPVGGRAPLQVLRRRYGDSGNADESRNTSNVVRASDTPPIPAPAEADNPDAEGDTSSHGTTVSLANGVNRLTLPDTPPAGVASVDNPLGFTAMERRSMEHRQSAGDTPVRPSAIASPPTVRNPAAAPAGNNNNGNRHITQRMSIPNWINTVPTPGVRMRDNGVDKALADVKRLFP